MNRIIKQNWDKPEIMIIDVSETMGDDGSFEDIDGGASKG